jgi:hypothetical protein
VESRGAPVGPGLTSRATGEFCSAARSDFVPVLLGRGRRLFDCLPDRVELEPIRTLEGRQATHLRYRVVSRAT